jgi:hypothetical protein
MTVVRVETMTKTISQFDKLDLALNAMEKHRKPGNGCWTLRPGIAETWNGNRWTQAERFQLTHEEPAPQRPLNERQRAREQRKRHWANAKRLAAVQRETLDDCRVRMARDYALWLCQRDGVAVPNAKAPLRRYGSSGWSTRQHGVVFQLDYDYLTEEQMPGVKWHQRKRIRSVTWGEMDTETFTYKRGSRTFRDEREVFTPLLTVAIPHWDHVPQMTETTESDSRPFLMAAE